MTRRPSSNEEGQTARSAVRAVSRDVSPVLLHLPVDLVPIFLAHFLIGRRTAGEEGTHRRSMARRLKPKIQRIAELISPIG